MTPDMAEVQKTHLERFHKTHVDRRKAWQSKAVPDDGIDLKRLRRGFRWVEMRPRLPVVQDAPALPAEAPASKPTHHFIVKTIQRTVAARYDVRVLEMTSANREWRNARPRQIAMYLAKKITGQSLPWVGRQFGGRDHTTVLHAVRKVGRRASEDFVYGTELAVMECLIRKGMA